MELKNTVLGIELGSTRIKAVLIDERHLPIASGDFEWENQLVNGIWTYSMDMVHFGLQTCFANLKADVKARFGLELSTVGAICPSIRTGSSWRNSVPGATPSPARRPGV